MERDGGIDEWARGKHKRHFEDERHRLPGGRAESYRRTRTDSIFFRLGIYRGDGTAPIWPGSPVDVRINGKKITRGLKPWHVATGMLKSELYGWLKLDRPTEESGEPFPPGYCHLAAVVGNAVAGACMAS